MAARWHRRRLIAVALVFNEDRDLLLCRMPKDRGVFPGQWSLPGGGVEEGERIEEALRREVHEELGLEVDDVEQLFFRDLVHTKLRDGASELIYMVFLVFSCRAMKPEVKLSEEFDAYAWVAPSELPRYVHDAFTLGTLQRAGLIPNTGTAK